MAKPEAKPEAVLFAAMCRYALNLSHNDGMAWWQGLATSKNPQVTWVSRRLERYRGRPESFKRYLAYVVSTIPPKALVESLEVLHNEGHLSRKQTTDIEEGLFALMHQGKWA